MKRVVFGLIFLVAAFAAEGQNETAAPADSVFMVTVTLGPAWDKAKKANEQTYFKEHSAHLSDLRKRGVIKFGARVAEEGVLVIVAANTVVANELIKSDPSMVNKLFNANVRKMSVFYDGCVEKPK